MKDHFNLIDEPWIPVAGHGHVSLKQIFTTEKKLPHLGGTPVDKIVLTKLLQAIAQAAATPENDEKWCAMGWEGLVQECHTYLQKWHDRFYLYGEKPFLQLPAVKKAETKSCGVFMPDIATDNTSLLTQHQFERPLDDKQKALLLLTQMSMALGGKKPDHRIVLTQDYAGKTKTSKPGPGVGHTYGVLHSFTAGDFLQQTIWLNLLTKKDLENIGLFTYGIGSAPWEQMPDGEDCAIAKGLKNSLMGRLIPLCRFCLLTENNIYAAGENKTENGIHITEGISHLGYKDGLVDPSITVAKKKKKEEDKEEWKPILADPNKRPWRSLPALLGFLREQGGSHDCFQLHFTLQRALDKNITCGVWSGGFRVRSNAGEQYATGKDDMLEALYRIPSKKEQEGWFEHFSQEMIALDKLSKKLYGSVINYFKKQKLEGKYQAEEATFTFWQLCEPHAQTILDNCDCENKEKMHKLHRKLASYLWQSYNQICPRQTARQLSAWADSRPSTVDYTKPHRET